MKSTASINGHPIHPMVIPYPFALLTAAAAFDVAGRAAGRPDWSQTASRMTRVGIMSALAAAVPGIVDYFGTVPRGTETSRTATRHALSNLSALACFALAQQQRADDDQPSAAGLTLALAGTALLSIGGWLGGELVYHHAIGVPDEPTSPVRRVEIREPERDAVTTTPATARRSRVPEVVA